MDFELLYPSKYLKAADLGDREVTKTIGAVKLEDLEGADGTKKQKVIVTFKDAKKQWVMPRTCGEALRLMFGKETNAWTGKRVTLYSRKVDSFGEEVDAVRVKGSPDIKAAIKEVVPRGRKKIIVDVIVTKGDASPEPGSAG